jgi:hypothetical protein
MKQREMVASPAMAHAFYTGPRQVSTTSSGHGLLPIHADGMQMDADGMQMGADKIRYGTNGS